MNANPASAEAGKSASQAGGPGPSAPAVLVGALVVLLVVLVVVVTAHLPTGGSDRSVESLLYAAGVREGATTLQEIQQLLGTPIMRRQEADHLELLYVLSVQRDGGPRMVSLRFHDGQLVAIE